MYQPHVPSTRETLQRHAGAPPLPCLSYQSFILSAFLCLCPMHHRRMLGGPALFWCLVLDTTDTFLHPRVPPPTACGHWWDGGHLGPGESLCSFGSLSIQLEEEKAALLGRQQQAEHATSLAVEKQERLEQLRLEQEVERQGLEGSLCVAEQAREALGQQILVLRSERSHLQEQVAQVGEPPCTYVIGAPGHSRAILG